MRYRILDIRRVPPSGSRHAPPISFNRKPRRSLSDAPPYTYGRIIESPKFRTPARPGGDEYVSEARPDPRDYGRIVESLRADCWTPRKLRTLMLYEKLPLPAVCNRLTIGHFKGFDNVWTPSTLARALKGDFA